MTYLVIKIMNNCEIFLPPQEGISKNSLLYFENSVTLYKTDIYLTLVNIELIKTLYIIVQHGKTRAPKQDLMRF